MLTLFSGCSGSWDKVFKVLMLYKVVQRSGVTCLFTGQYDSALLWHITDVI